MWFDIYGRNRGHTAMHQRDRECDNQGPRSEGNRNGQYGSFCLNFPSQTPYQSSYQSQFQFPNRQPSFFPLNSLSQGFSQTSFPFCPINQNPPSSNTYQQRPTGIGMVQPQAPTGSNQCQPLQSTPGNTNSNPNPYRGAYQNQTGQYRPNYPRPNYTQPSHPQSTKAYHSEATDRLSQFDDYENDYYNNGRFEQGDSWANYAIDEDRAFDEICKEAPEANEDVDAHQTIAQASYHCCRCPESFSSNNALHKHVRSSHNPAAIKQTPTSTQNAEIKPIYITAPSLLTTTMTSNEKFVRSNTTLVSAKGYGFRGWHYATIQARLSQHGQTTSICLDTGCTASLIDRGFLNEHVPGAEIKKMASPMKVRGLGSSSHAAGDYVELDLYLPADHDRTAVIRREIHVVDDLKANILIGTDILVPEQINMLLSQRKAVIGSCQNVELDLNITTLPNQTNRLLLSNDQTIIPAYGSTIVQIKPLHGLPTDQDLLFEPECKLADTYAYTSIVDHTLTIIEVRNDSDRAVTLPRHTPLGRIIEYEADGCFLAYPGLINRVSRPKSKLSSWIKLTF